MGGCRHFDCGGRVKKSAAPTALVLSLSETQRSRAGLTSVAPPALGLWRTGIVDCQRDGFSDIVRDSGCAGRTRESEAEDFVGRRGGIAGGAFGRGNFTGARFAGEFEPGIADMDRRRARDKWKHVGYGRVEFGVAVRIDFDQPTWAGIFEGAIGVRV